jgi:hypothetical protein
VRTLIAWAVLLAACAPVVQPAPSGSPSASIASPAMPRDEPFASPTVAPTPVTPPAARLDEPIVAVTADPFPIVKTLALTKAAISPGDAELASRGVQNYLVGLDRYRDNGDFLPVRGAFGKAVAEALVASRTPGVKRTFVLESLRIENLYRKPWGTLALADVRVTIADHAVDGSAPDQREAGLLRLGGDDRRLSVADGWDESKGAWFNGHIAEDLAGLREAIVQPIGFHLRTESWLAGMQAETYWDGAGATPFQKSRRAYLATLDRAGTTSRTFADVIATIERFDTFSEMAGGIATVRVEATLVTFGPGRPQRQPVTRRVKVFFGNWMPEVVDEEITPGVWRSGGDLALIDIDVNRA